jgi:hypothetical protein
VKKLIRWSSKILTIHLDRHLDKVKYIYNKCKSTFQFSNLAKYGHGPPKGGFKGNRNM